MLKNIIGMKVDDARVLMKEYYHMINEEEYDRDMLNELNAYFDIGKQASRIKCATLPFQTLEKTIKIYEGVGNEK